MAFVLLNFYTSLCLYCNLYSMYDEMSYDAMIHTPLINQNVTTSLGLGPFDTEF